MYLYNHDNTRCVVIISHYGELSICHFSDLALDVPRDVGVNSDLAKLHGFQLKRNYISKH